MDSRYLCAYLCSSTSSKQAYSSLTNIKEYKMFTFITTKAFEITAYDTMPCWAILIIKKVLDI